MSGLIETVATLTVVTALAVGAMFVLPRQKPEAPQDIPAMHVPPVEVKVLPPPPPPAVEPEPEKSDAVNDDREEINGLKQAIERANARAERINAKLDEKAGK